MKAVKLLARWAYTNLLPSDLFMSDVSLPRARELFSRFVRLVEVENHNYCNRVCSFCPNAKLDRRSQIIQIEESLFRKIIGDLAEIDYDQTLAWSRYHESLAHESIFDRLAYARDALPRALLQLTSNGDYITPERLRKLEAIGVNRMCVSLYLPEGSHAANGKVDSAMNDFVQRTGLTIGRSLGDCVWRMNGTSMQVTVSVPDLYVPGSRALSNRGGLVKFAVHRFPQRTSVCFSPLKHVVIDYNGKSMLCCQVRSDAPEHQEAIIGDLSRDGYGLFRHYRDLASARAALFVGGPKTGVCQMCPMNAAGPYRFGRNKRLATILDAFPGKNGILTLIQRRYRQSRQYELRTH